MDLEKIDKRTKEYKAQTPDNDTLTKVSDLISNGVPLRRIVFHDTVLSVGGNMGGEPENAFYDSGSKPSRTAKMWYTPHGVVIKQKNNYKIIPLAAVKDTDVLI